MTTTWQPTGNVHPLDEAIVASQVPAASGVYGLHNAHQQLFIGEAADLRAALLLHCRQSRKFFRSRQPTHLAFETCEAPSRALRAQALIAAHRPAVRSLQPFSLANLPTMKKKKSAPPAASGDQPSHDPQWPEARQADSVEAPAKYLSRGQLAALLSLSMVTAGLAGYLGVLSGQKIAERRIAVLQWAAYQRRAEESQTAAAAASLAVNGAATRPLDQPATPASAGEVPAPPVQVVQAAATQGNPDIAATKPALAVAANGERPSDAVKSSSAPTDSTQPTGNGWSVQIAATQDQKAAQEIQTRLKEKGFDAYIVEAELASGRWYRLRVGRFSARQEADATQQALLAKANIRDAFVTGK